MIWLVALTVLAFYFASFYRSQTFTATDYQYGQLPPVFTIVMKVLVRVLRRRQGRLHAAGRDQETGDKKEMRGDAADSEEMEHVTPSDDEIIVINNFRVTKKLLIEYNTICGGATDGDTPAVPLCFPECLFMWNFALLVCKPSFKLSPLGLIHIGQTIEQHEDLDQLLDAPCILETRTTDYRLVSKGVEVDITARIMSLNDRCVWSGVTTLLSRSHQTRTTSGMASSSRQQCQDPIWDSEDRCTRHKLEVAGDIGLKYACVSGDWNPHHLYPWTARLLGYHAPIAHGLWTLAKSVDLISGSGKGALKFKKIKGQFKRPLFLPGGVTVEHYTEGGTVYFRVIDSKTKVPHLVGSLV